MRKAVAGQQDLTFLLTLVNERVTVSRRVGLLEPVMGDKRNTQVTQLFLTTELDRDRDF